MLRPSHSIHQGVLDFDPREFTDSPSPMILRGAAPPLTWSNNGVVGAKLRE
ncbi:MAG: hypothetical protein ABSG70_13565 [Terriglobales bacterium]